ncbi:hypothetical protein J4Q44_G00224500 [Coregonus suidteri]|uniref:Uncharacterized protein n=1 Tax=Coregonus suidteri TaxID=861788 RepID=A0AAN8LF49_9TELE
MAAVKKELCEGQSEQQKETSHLSSSLISTLPQLQEVQQEWEQLLAQQRSLQDAFDQLQAKAKFEADQSRQQLEDKQQDVTAQQAQITVSQLLFKPTKPCFSVKDIQSLPVSFV